MGGVGRADERRKQNRRRSSSRLSTRSRCPHSSDLPNGGPSSPSRPPLGRAVQCGAAHSVSLQHEALKNRRSVRANRPTEAASR